MSPYYKAGSDYRLSENDKRRAVLIYGAAAPSNSSETPAAAQPTAAPASAQPTAAPAAPQSTEQVSKSSCCCTM